MSSLHAAAVDDATFFVRWSVTNPLASLANDSPSRSSAVSSTMNSSSNDASFTDRSKAATAPGDTVAIWGCGPVGLFTVQSALLLGAERVIGRLMLSAGKPLSVKLELQMDDVTESSFRLRAERPAHFQETIYFDHPAMGVLVRIDPQN